MSPGCFQPLLIGGFDIYLMSRARAAAGAQAGQLPAVLPELPQLTGSVLGGHRPPTGFHRKERARCRAHSDDKQPTHPQRCRCFLETGPAKAWFDRFCSCFDRKHTPCRAGQSWGYRTGSSPMGSACTPRWVRSTTAPYAAFPCPNSS